MTRFIQAKNILSPLKKGSDTYFGIRYNMNLYRGCQHSCIYCDSRSKCYGIENFTDIQVKENSIELLEKELRSKREKGTIGFGSMNDPYMPIEKELMLSRKALEVIARHKFPVHLITKSNLVCRDIDLLQEISKTYAAVSVTITTSNDVMSRQIEPGAPLSSLRFETIRTLSSAGVYCGITLMPVLPYITDTPDNIEQLVLKAKDAGAGYILASMGMTLREGQREYYYDQLDKRFPGLKENYMVRYGHDYSCNIPEHRKLWLLFQETCQKVGIPYAMKFYAPREPIQQSLF
jgi:DNA repair photolyase